MNRNVLMDNCILKLTGYHNYESVQQNKSVNVFGKFVMLPFPSLLQLTAVS